MGTTRRNSRVERKPQLMQEADHYGITGAIRKQQKMAESLFHRRKKKFNQDGISGLQLKCQHIDPEVKLAQSENERLKGIIVNQALKHASKTVLLKQVFEDTGCNILYPGF
jgi:hypothetical protein